MKLNNIVSVLILNAAFLLIFATIIGMLTTLSIYFLLGFSFIVGSIVTLLILHAYKAIEGTKKAPVKFIYSIMMLYAIFSLIYLVMKLGDYQKIFIYSLNDIEALVVVGGFLFTILGTALAVKTVE